ncbi:MAG: prolipoprotein diacylglyceryl transferase family protein [Patescibacteria group bacterium]
MWYQSIQTLSIGGLQIQVWGLMLAVGSILGWWLFDYNLLWRKIKIDTSWLVLGFIFFSLVGARLIHVGLNWSLYSNDWLSIFWLWQGGMASYGAFIFGICFIWFYRRWYIKSGQQIDFIDATVPAMCLVLMMARVGCFLINDHIGKVADLFWSIWVMGSMRHPLSMYYVLLDFFLFVLTLNFYYQSIMRGRLLWLVLIIYGVGRLLIDWLYKDFMGDNLSFGATMVVSLIFVIFGAIMLYNQSRKFP